MLRNVCAVFLAMTWMTMSALSAAAGDAKTTRIEPRPYYGAVVTHEAGVRVFRPLPPTKHLIINPGNRTKVNLSQTDVNVRATSRNYIFPAPGSGVVGGFGGSFNASPFGLARGSGRANSRGNNVRTAPDLFGRRSAFRGGRGVRRSSRSGRRFGRGGGRGRGRAGRGGGRGF